MECLRVGEPFEDDPLSGLPSSLGVDHPFFRYICELVSNHAPEGGKRGPSHIPIPAGRHLDWDLAPGTHLIVTAPCQGLLSPFNEIKFRSLSTNA